VPPFSYDSVEVTFPSAEPGVTLGGTLISPKGPGSFTTVVLITGSGAQNRNEELLNHRPFLVLADALARANIAVLRYDDRGVGNSTGNFAAATSLNFADDVRGAVSYLRSQSQVPIGSIGLIGHSEGRLIAPMVADADANIAFLVLHSQPDERRCWRRRGAGKRRGAAERRGAGRLPQTAAGCRRPGRRGSGRQSPAIRVSVDALLRHL
jgi:pimeloyl-ACP methyl ester carboxylesterase